MKFAKKLISAITAACLVIVAAAGCSPQIVAGTPTADAPTTAVPPKLTITQSALLPEFIAEQNPMNVLKSGLYNVLRHPIGTSVAITGYRYQVATDGTTSTNAVFAFNPAADAWQPVTNKELVWSPSRTSWVESDLTEALSAGPAGSLGWPTVRGVADFGSNYYTFSYQELGGRALGDGLESGFAQGGELPLTALNGKFSPGARAYLSTTTSVDPQFTIQRIKDANTDRDNLVPVYACGTPSARCATLAPTLSAADTQGGQFTNIAGTARLELDGDGHATLRPVETDIAYANLTYRLVNSDGPPRITFAANNADDAEKFSQAVGIPLDSFAFYEYGGQVTIGRFQPADSTSSAFAGYNKIAANDLLTQWTPALPAVLP
jgi:hypothetical protein